MRTPFKVHCIFWTSLCINRRRGKAIIFQFIFLYHQWILCFIRPLQLNFSCWLSNEFDPFVSKERKGAKNPSLYGELGFCLEPPWFTKNVYLGGIHRSGLEVYCVQGNVIMKRRPLNQLWIAFEIFEFSRQNGQNCTFKILLKTLSFGLEIQILLIWQSTLLLLQIDALRYDVL